MHWIIWIQQQFTGYLLSAWYDFFPFIFNVVFINLLESNLSCMHPGKGAECRGDFLNFFSCYAKPFYAQRGLSGSFADQMDAENSSHSLLSRRQSGL